MHRELRFFCDCDCDFLTQVKAPPPKYFFSLQKALQSSCDKKLQAIAIPFAIFRQNKETSPLGGVCAHSRPCRDPRATAILSVWSLFVQLHSRTASLLGGVMLFPADSATGVFITDP